MSVPFPSHENYDIGCWISDSFNRTRNEILISLENENYLWIKGILLFNSDPGNSLDNSFWNCCICEEMKPTLNKLVNFLIFFFGFSSVQNFFHEHALVLEQRSRNYTSYTLCDSVPINIWQSQIWCQSSTDSSQQLALNSIA